MPQGGEFGHLTTATLHARSGVPLSRGGSAASGSTTSSRRPSLPQIAHLGALSHERHVGPPTVVREESHPSEMENPFVYFVSQQYSAAAAAAAATASTPPADPAAAPPPPPQAPATPDALSASATLLSFQHLAVAAAKEPVGPSPQQPLELRSVEYDARMQYLQSLANMQPSVPQITDHRSAAPNEGFVGQATSGGLARLPRIHSVAPHNASARPSASLSSTPQKSRRSSNTSIVTLITRAIKSSEHTRLTADQVAAWIRVHYPRSAKSVLGLVPHELLRNPQFERTSCPPTLTLFKQLSSHMGGPLVAIDTQYWTLKSTAESSVQPPSHTSTTTSTKATTTTSTAPATGAGAGFPVDPQPAYSAPPPLKRLKTDLTAGVRKQKRVPPLKDLADSTRRMKLNATPPLCDPASSSSSSRKLPRKTTSDLPSDFSFLSSGLTALPPL